MSSQNKTLLIGLGNREKSLSNTRHNAGIEFINFCSKRSLPQALVPLASTSVMNSSGKFVKNSLKSQKVADFSKNLIVVADEMELPVGQWRYKAAGSPGGHNGLKSVFQTVGSSDVPRLMIGIGRPSSRNPDEVGDFVLSKFPAEDKQKLLKEVFPEMLSFLERKFSTC